MHFLTFASRFYCTNKIENNSFSKENELKRYQPKETTLRGLIFGYLILEKLIKDYERLLIKSLRVIQQSCERQDIKRCLVLTLLLQL